VSWLRETRARCLAILVLTSLAACDRPDGKWIIEHIDNRAIALSRRVMHVEFVDGRFSTDTGCNGLTGRYVAFAGHIWFSDLRQHAMLCRAPVMELEDAITDRFGHARTFERRTDGTLVLHAHSGQSVTLRAVPG
jgi:heat shock protein HslJ